MARLSRYVVAIGISTRKAVVQHIALGTRLKHKPLITVSELSELLGD